MVGYVVAAPSLNGPGRQSRFMNISPGSKSLVPGLFIQASTKPWLWTVTVTAQRPWAVNTKRQTVTVNRDFPKRPWTVIPRRLPWTVTPRRLPGIVTPWRLPLTVTEGTQFA